MKNIRNSFPTEVFPKSIEDYIEAYVQATDLSVDFASVSILVALGTSSGDAYNLRVKSGYEVKPSIYCVLIGNSGTGKTAPVSMAFKPIRKVSRKQYAKYKIELKRYESYLRQSDKEEAVTPESTKPVLNPYILNDYTLEALLKTLEGYPKSITILVDELNGFFENWGRYNKSSDSEFYSSFWSAEEYCVTRASGESFYIPNTTLSVFGTIQPDLLKTMFGGKRDISGSMARFLFCYPTELRIPAFRTQDVDTSIADSYNSTIDRMLQLDMMQDADNNRTPRTIQFSTLALKKYEQWYNNTYIPLCEEEQRQYIKEALVKLSQYVLRFSLILQISYFATQEESDEAVDIRALEGAIKLFEYFRAALEKVYSIVYDEDITLKMGEVQRTVYNNITTSEFYIGEPLYKTVYEKYGFTKDQLKKFVRNREYFTRISKGKYKRNYVKNYED